MSDNDQGVYRKYDVHRRGGTPGKHDDCTYYVLDLVHDPHSVPALRAYADSCEGEYPDLAADLRRMADGWRPELGEPQ